MGASAERVTAALRADVLTGVLAPGSRLPEPLLQERYGTSRVPVREALRALAGEGFVELRPNAGARVAQVPVEDLADLYAVRRVAEGVTAARCAALVATGRAGGLVADLDRLVEQGLAAVAEERRADGARLNAEFHERIATASGARSMAQVLRWASDRIRWAYATTVPQQGQRAWAEHRRVARAIASGDAARAAEVMERHVAASARAFQDPARAARAAREA
ncbi:GntR family transcriptional regulator [Kineococcus indalonis]|uniref:GntR family transcriptional regulator n=1 Tax=Kineococcus indalonis TaxID=2696566 RepID=UPI0014127E03|nr:GntR family transcriptional regulator [Kineococcus indalonis]NAZ87563.1 FCD domain-containing protein [Kineococcus indalonis]